jgi:hypothetical protein
MDTLYIQYKCVCVGGGGGTILQCYSVNELNARIITLYVDHNMYMVGENCIMSTLIVYAVHKMPSGLSDKE